MEATTTPDGFTVKKIPEAMRTKRFTAILMAGRPCIWAEIERAERRLAGLVLSASKIEAH